MKKLLSSLAFVGFTVSGAMAADTWLVDFSALDSLIGRPAEVAAFRISIPYGSNPTISGVDFGFWGRSDRAWGAQLNLAVNDVREKMGGVQMAALNLDEDVTGVQLGFWNETATLAGVQFGGLNFAEDADFLQFGVGNYANAMKGLQVGGWDSCPNLTGVQFGFINMAQTVEGYQLGLINKTDKMRGFQLGFINIITASPVPVFPFFNCFF